MSRLDDALHKLNQGKLQEGQQILEALRRQDPDNPQVLYNLGMCYSEQGMFDRSIEVLDHCITVAPDFSNAYAALGFSYEHQGETQKALEVLEEARARAPQNFYILKNLGSIYGKLGRIEDAIECLGAANEVQPDTPEVLYGLAYAYEQQGLINTADLIYIKLLQMETPEEIAELARAARTRIGMDSLKSQGLRIDAVMYCVDALETFEDMSQSEVQTIAFEIAMLGRQGLDINDAAQQYQLKSLPGDFSGLRLLSYMYVGFQILDPSVDIGADLSEEYQMARKMFKEQSDAA